MSFIAVAERTTDASPEACYARIADFSSWSRWMPASFRPVDGPSPLTIDARLRVRIQGTPGVTGLTVAVARAPAELAWRGGVPGLLAAVHAFRFEAHAGGTRIRSEETWTGLFARGPVARTLKALAERVGNEQVEALIADLRAHP